MTLKPQSINNKWLNLEFMKHMIVWSISEVPENSQEVECSLSTQSTCISSKVKAKKNARKNKSIGTCI